MNVYVRDGGLWLEEPKSLKTYKETPLAEFMANLTRITDMAPDEVRGTLTVELDTDYDGEPRLTIMRAFSAQETADYNRRV